jgi:hypothetical protein
MRSILVEDASGAQFILYEFVDRGPIMSLFREEKRFQLDTGELAERVDENTFAVISTGERLMRVT